MAITNSKQDWTVGQSVKVGELRLLLPYPKDFLISLLTYVRESTTLITGAESLKMSRGTRIGETDEPLN